MRRVRRDGHRQPDQERHPLDRGPLLARRRDRPAEPLRAHARQHAASHRCSCSAGRTRTCPFLQECWRLRIPQTWDERGYDYPEGRPDRRARSSSPRTRSTTRRSAPCSTACTRRPTVGVYTRPRGARRVHHAPAARRASARPRARRSSSGRAELDDFRELYKIPKFIPATFEPGPRCAASSASTAARRRRRRSSSTTNRQHPRQGLPALEGQPDPGHEGAPRAAQGVRHRRRAPTLEVLGFGATGYAADVLEECVRADVNIVETVAHMMSAVHFFGDVDVICDIGGQDIKVLFMKNGDIANFRLSNSVLRRQRHAPAGDGRLSSACRSPSTPTPRSGAELAPKFSYGCAVFLDTDRVNFQKEGFSKEEMLAGLAQVLPKNVWQYVVQIPRLAALGTQVRPPGRHAVQPRRRQSAGRLHQGARARRRGVRPPAHRRSRRDRRRDGDAARRQAQGQLDLHRHRCGDRLEYTTKNDEETRLSLLPERVQAHVHRHEARPTARPAATSPASPARRAPSSPKEAMLALVAERKKIAEAVPEHGRLRVEARVQALLRPAPMPEDGSPIEDVEVKQGLPRHAPHRRSTRPFRRSAPRRWKKRRAMRIGIPRVLNMYSTAPFFRTYFEALGIPKQNVVFSDETTEEMWVEGGKYGSIDPCYPSKVAQAHVHNLLFHHHTRREEAQLHLLPDPHARADLRRTTRWTTRAARSSPARPT